MVGRDMLALNLPQKEMEAFCVKQLEAGDAIWFACDAGAYGARKDHIDKGIPTDKEAHLSPRKNKHIALFRIICIRLQGPKILLRQYIRNPESISKPRQKREAEPLNEKGESIPTHSFNMIAK